MPRPVVPEAAAVAGKWVRRATGAAMDYVQGVVRTPKSQSALARAARGLWVQQITNPATHDRWANGLARSGDEGWRAGVQEKGQQRFGPGVTASEGKFGSRMTGILQAISGVEIPVRGLPASESNFQRSRLIGVALNRLKGTFAR